MPRGPVAVALGCGAIGIAAALWLAMHSSEAPAHPSGIIRLSAEPDDVLVVDGGTLRLAGSVVRLDRVVAPARGSLCRSASGADFDCGDAAATALAALIAGRRVDCDIGPAADGGGVAACVSGGIDLNAAALARGR